jgi:hypothetical protein
MDAEEKLQAITEALFPDPVPTGKERHRVSHDVTDNIMAAIYDLERTNADTGCIRTLKKIEQQLLVAKRFAKPVGS